LHTAPSGLPVPQERTGLATHHHFRESVSETDLLRVPDDNLTTEEFIPL
jgi:hypothetical protein